MLRSARAAHLARKYVLSGAGRMPPSTSAASASNAATVDVRRAHVAPPDDAGPDALGERARRDESIDTHDAHSPLIRNCPSRGGPHVREIGR